MKKTLLITGVLLALTASLASAAGIDLYWNDCNATSGLSNKNFLCNTNTGNFDLYMSFDPPGGIIQMNGNNQFMDLQSLSNPLPVWWHYRNAGTCRLASLIASGDCTVGVSSGADCSDPWQASGSASIAGYSIGVLGDPRRARMIGSISVPGALAGAASSGTQYYSMRVRINAAKTVGSGLCAGCLDPVCLVLNEIRLTQPPGVGSGDQPIVDILHSNYCTWQGGQVGGAGCPGATPTRNATWGSVKSLYR